MVWDMENGDFPYTSAKKVIIPFWLSIALKSIKIWSIAEERK